MDLPLVSATQIQTWIDCNRKWGFKYLERIQTPQHPAAALGAEVQDTQLDPYLLRGQAFDFSRKSGEIAHALAPLLPAPGAPGMVLRRKFVMPSPTGRFAYQGELDVFGADSGIVPKIGGASAVSSGRKLCGDVKTTSNLDYAKTSEVLLTDVQASIYEMDLMFEENVDDLDVVWWYVRTRKPYRTALTHLRVFAPHVAEQFGRIDEIGSSVVATRSATPKVEELKPNARMCEQYGGCPFRSRCNLSPAVFAAAVVEASVNTSSLDWLKKMKKDAPASPPPGTFTVHAAGPEASLQPGVHPLPAGPPAPLPAANPFAPPAPTGLPAWATSPVDPMHARQAPLPVVMPTAHGATGPAPVNPPEAAQPPAPPVGLAAPAATPTEAAKRGRPRKTPEASPSEGKTVPESLAAGAPGVPAPTLAELGALVVRMRTLGVKKLAMMEGKIYEVALFDQVTP